MDALWETLKRSTIFLEYLPKRTIISTKLNDVLLNLNHKITKSQ